MWLLVSIIAYFITSLEIILDKFLLSSKRVSHPAIYAFYSGLLSLTALLIFAPFGFHLVGPEPAVLMILGGAVFVYGILLLFFAINKDEASRVIPVVGAVIPIVTYLISLRFLEEKLMLLQLLGVALLIGGGLLISFDLETKSSKKLFSGFYYSVAAGTLLALAFSFFKGFYEKDNFINVFIWTRGGLFFGALSLCLVPAWRRIIFGSLANFKKPQKEHYQSGSLFVFGKILGGTGSIMLNYAIAIGSVTIVNALVSTEYVFIFLLGIIFSFWYPKVFQERRSFSNILQKVSSILIIMLGIYLVSNFNH